MTVASANSLPPLHSASQAESSSDAQIRQVAEQFEAIFLRQLLKPLERTTSGATGGHVYGALVVGGAADAAAAGGGIGLAEVLTRALMQAAAPAGSEALGPDLQKRGLVPR